MSDDQLEVVREIVVAEDDPARDYRVGDHIYEFSNGEIRQIRMIPRETFAKIRDEAGASLVRVHPSSPEIGEGRAITDAIERWTRRKGN